MGHQTDRDNRSQIGPKMCKAKRSAAVDERRKKRSKDRAYGICIINPVEKCVRLQGRATLEISSGHLLICESTLFKF
jgi:hypothetical protein